MIRYVLAACALLLAAACSKPPPVATPNPLPVPSTVSPQWQKLLAKMGPPSNTPPPAVDNHLAWAIQHMTVNGVAGAVFASRIHALGTQVTEDSLGGVPVLHVKPRNWKPGKRLAVYTHGGGYTQFSAHSSLISAALFAEHTGLEVISIDYTIAPDARWPTPLNQVEAVFRALKDQGVDLGKVVMYGDSAGGGLTAASALKLRDDGVGLLGALVLWSPWTDLTGAGDSRNSLAAADPILRSDVIQMYAADYVAPADEQNPLASPVYGDFSKGYPPTLIQIGTREILLSDAVRFYQALDQAGVPVKLDMYEGMIHVFQIFSEDAPECLTALDKVHRFVDQYLGPG